MKIRSDIILAEVAGEYLAVPTGPSAENNRVIMKLNSTGHFIWQAVAEGRSADEIASAITDEYEIGLADAREKTVAFLAKLAEIGVLED